MPTAAEILKCRPELAQPVLQAVHNKLAEGWRMEDIVTYIREMNPNLTADEIHQLADAED